MSGLPVVMCVAEKPSLAASIAGFLSDGKHRSRRGGQEVHEFERDFNGARCHFKVTAVIGHVLSIDFPSKFQSWELDPAILFDAPVQKKEATPKARVVEHLEREAKGASHLILWLDCDREGENICFEVIDACAPVMRPNRGDKFVHRAKFSAVSKESIERAMRTLGAPNRDEALAVDARQELDLKVGVAFTRFQTRFFQGRYSHLDASVISYGPCQTPTLNFAVQRHLEIVSHAPEDFWSLRVDVRSAAMGRTLATRWERERVFDADVGEMFRSMVSGDKHALVQSVEETEEFKRRPPGLNTVDLLKAASAGMGMGAHRAMQVAERLYIQGFISYPRTESTAYPPGFDLKGTLTAQRGHPAWGEWVEELLSGSVAKPRGGKDAGDHPPITPVRSATESAVGGGEAWRIFDFVARHFIASVSPDCAYVSQRAVLVAGGERFHVGGRTVTAPGWTTVMPHRAIDDDPLGEIREGESLPIATVELQQGATSPPPYLSEAELIGLMERNSIGTDASIPTHINNIEKRNYVRIQSQGGRRVVPTDLGVTLVQGYHRIDPELALPAVRSHVEKQLDMIATGKADHESIVRHTLAQFAAKFRNFVDQIERMDTLFEASFDPTCSSGKPFSKCGRCLRYMRLVSTRPQRLYCPTQEEVLELPAGAVKLYNNRECQLCGFELLLFQNGDRTYPMCPWCFNHPPLAGGPGPKGLVSGAPHPRAHPIIDALLVCPCPECGEDDKLKGREGGWLMLEPVGGPRWKFACTGCALVVKLDDSVHKVTVDRLDMCGACGARCPTVIYHKDRTPLAGGETTHVACLACDDLLNSSIELARGRSGGRGDRGGRGGRGRGRGRGRKPPSDHDQKMSFKDF